MKRLLSIFSLFVFAPVMAFAYGDGEGRQMEFGIDVELPYTLSVGGTSVNETGDTTLGLHGNYFWTDAISVGLQVDFALESTAGSDNNFFITPGAAYYFNAGETWDPYLRVDIPILLTNSSDVGASGGIGILWNLTELTGVDGLGIKYDFAMNYFFDNEILSLNIFRIAVSYFW